MAQSRREVDAFTLQAKRMPKSVRAQYIAKAEEMKKRLISRGNRAMWGGEREEGEEE